HQAFANDEAAERAGEIDPQPRELDARLPAARLLRSAGDAFERGFAAHREVADVEDALLRRLIGALRIERHPHLAADNLGIDVVEAEERAGVVGLDEDHLPAVIAAAAHVADERGIAPELGVQREAGDGAAAPRHPQVEAAQGLTVEADDRADL